MSDNNGLNNGVVVFNGNIQEIKLSQSAEENLNLLKLYDRNTNITALVLGKLLSENILSEYWKKLGYDSFSDFIAQGGFSFTKRTAYNYVDLWSLFLEWKIDYEEMVSIPYSKILRIKDVVDKDNLEEWLGKAKELSRTDLDLEVREAGEVKKNKDFKPLPKIYLCKDCGGWIIELMPDEVCKCGKGLQVSESP